MCNFLNIKKVKYILAVLFLTCVIIPVPANIIQDADSIFKKERTLKAEDLIRGERLFFGLVYLENRSVNCASCHNVRESDTLNWNPDAVEISKKFQAKSAGDLNAVLLKPSGKKLAEVHKEFKLSPEDVIMIKAYMDRLADSGLKQNKPVITNLLLFIIASLLFLFSMTDLIISKILKRRWINYGILLSTGVFITYTLYVEGIAVGRSLGYSPFQPVKFSHAIHSGQNKTDCIYCHSFAETSKSAGIPPENVCMNCHIVVRNGTRSGVSEISKVISAYENMEPIEWIKVHNVPDHGFFSHAQHVSAGGVTCQECHGKVEEMDVISQVNDLSMGWCINCHRTKNINFQNKFYTEYKDLGDKFHKGEIDTVTISMVGGIECMKCHY